ncbi:radical SAM protein [Leptolyngbya sp. 15MV]|nr:radical SAM protein [Leptolyngbya sp. 15MV]
MELYASRPIIGGRRPRFVYFGGGTPSYLSPEQFTHLATRMRELLPWDEAEEITVEAEPGTLNERKLRALRDLGITRLSLGIEHFDDHVLEVNGRAHRSAEALRAYAIARDLRFPEINVDLIAGMVEETPERWDHAVARTIDLAPDTVTIYQMEVPYNTTIYQRMKAQGALEAPVADWATKRAWVDLAFQRLAAEGYTITSATTAVRDPARQRFVYRNGLFDGSDVLSIGVSAFGHLSGVNYQNEHHFDPYVDAASSRRLPTHRAYALTREERCIREFALQLKAGRVAVEPFTRKFGVDPRVQFAHALAVLDARGHLARADDQLIELTRSGLLQGQVFALDAEGMGPAGHHDPQRVADNRARRGGEPEGVRRRVLHEVDIAIHQPANRFVRRAPQAVRAVVRRAPHQVENGAAIGIRGRGGELDAVGVQHVHEIRCAVHQRRARGGDVDGGTVRPVDHALRLREAMRLQVDLVVVRRRQRAAGDVHIDQRCNELLRRLQPVGHDIAVDEAMCVAGDRVARKRAARDHIGLHRGAVVQQLEGELVHPMHPVAFAGGKAADRRAAVVVVLHEIARLQVVARRGGDGVPGGVHARAVELFA